MSEDMRVVTGDAALIRVPAKYFGMTEAYADGYVAGREAAQERSRAQEEMVSNAFDRGRMLGYARCAETAGRVLDAAKKQAETLRRSMATYGFMPVLRVTELVDLLLGPEPEKLGPEAVPPDPCPTTPARPLLFTTHNKGAYILTHPLDKCFPNEIAPGWWTITVNGKPILEDA